MRRHPTIAEKRWPDPPVEFLEVAKAWFPDASAMLIGYVWGGLDGFKGEVIDKIDVSGDEEEIERNITELLEPRIRDVMPSHSPFYIQHAAREMETRKPPPAQAPEYDLAFRLYLYPRIMWPIEAKVLHTDSRIAEYVNEINNNYLTCRYAPFSSEAAMLAYLVAGDPDKLFQILETRIQCSFKIHESFRNRLHRVSKHSRAVPPEKSYPSEIVLHHLVFSMN